MAQAPWANWDIIKFKVPAAEIEPATSHTVSEATSTTPGRSLKSRKIFIAIDIGFAKADDFLINPHKP